MKKLLNFENISNLSTLFVIVALFVCVMSSSITVHAATNDPYGYTYDDCVSGKTLYKYYSYSLVDNNYKLIREFYSKGSYLYFSNGTLITNSSAGTGSKYNGFDVNGQFYFLGKDGSVSAISTANKVSVLIPGGAVHLNYNTDEIVTTVTTTGGTFYLPSLLAAPEVDDDEDYTPPVVSKPQNRVDIYTNSANEQVYEAFNGGKIKVKLIVSSNGAQVLNATAKVRLTDTLKGAKFLGLDSNYNVYLYEPNALYRFKFGKWYSAEKLDLYGCYKSFSKDENGFISKVNTSSASFTIGQLTTSKKWQASKTYVVSKADYKTLYVKGSTVSHTLTKNSKTLKLDGKKIASGVSKYGFINAKKLIYMKGAKVYVANIKSPKKATLMYSNGKSLTANSVGLIKKVVTSNGTKKAF